MLKTPLDWQEVDALITLLSTQGISYLLGNGSAAGEDVEDVDSIKLIQRLAACNYPLVENASISLFLLHPELATSVVEALQHSSADFAENIAIVTLAALYLQQWWLVRLASAFGELPHFPEAPFVSLWEDRQLPAPDTGYGMPGLLALQEYQARRYGIPLNFLSDWQNQIDHLLIQEDVHERELSNSDQEKLAHLSLLEGENKMSMRQHVGRQEIEQFLFQVGRTRQAGRLYLTGGGALVHRGIRPDQTLDIAIHITADPGSLTSEITQLKHKMNINIEFASPGDFMPLPTQWEARSAFIKRYNQVDVFYFDWYSIALSKIQRANRQDVVDTQLLVQQDFVDLPELDKLYQDVLDKVGQPLNNRLFPNLSQQHFSQRYQAIRQFL